MKSQSTSITFLLLSALCIALVSAQSSCPSNVSITSDSQEIDFKPGDCIVTDSSGCYLILESNCNLVLYYGETPLWTSASFQDDTPNCKVAFQSDGHLVIYLYPDVAEESLPEASSRTFLWGSDTYTQIQEASLVISNEHHLQIVQTYNGSYNVTLDVSNPPPHQTPIPLGVTDTDSSSVIVLSTDPEDFVFQEQQYIGSLRSTYLIFQDDCNFVLFNEIGAQWASVTRKPVQYSCELAITRQGSLKIYAKDDPSVVFWTWNGTDAVQGEIIWTAVSVQNGVMEITYVAADRFTNRLNVTYTTANGNLELKQPQAEADSGGF